MTEIVKFTDGNSSLPATADDLISGLQNVTTAIQGVAGGMPYLRLLRSGVFAFGPENIEPEPGSLWAINPYSISHGFACWGDGELLGERMVPYNQKAPVRGELPDYGFEWDQQFGMQLQCLTGEDKGTVVLYRGTSTGLRNAAKKLIDQLIAQAQRDPKHIVPAIRLEVGEYHHKKYGDICFPVLDIQQWLTFETGQPAAVEESEAAEGDIIDAQAEQDEIPQADDIESSDIEDADVEAAVEGAIPASEHPRRARRTLHTSGSTGKRGGMTRGSQRSTIRRRRKAG